MRQDDSEREPQPPPSIGCSHWFCLTELGNGAERCRFYQQPLAHGIFCWLGARQHLRLILIFDRLCVVWSQEYQATVLSEGSSAPATKRQIRRRARHFPEICAENSHSALPAPMVRVHLPCPAGALHAKCACLAFQRSAQNPEAELTPPTEHFEQPCLDCPDCP